MKNHDGPDPRGLTIRIAQPAGAPKSDLYCLDASTAPPSAEARRMWQEFVSVSKNDNPQAHDWSRAVTPASPLPLARDQIARRADAPSPGQRDADAAHASTLRACSVFLEDPGSDQDTFIF